MVGDMVRNLVLGQSESGAVKHDDIPPQMKF